MLLSQKVMAEEKTLNNRFIEDMKHLVANSEGPN